MRKFCYYNFFLACSLFLGVSWFGLCWGEEDAYYTTSAAPMERDEKEALYSAIQGFVGEWWNGSDLYPDPCGWTPIQGVSCDLYNGLWYVSVINIGPFYDNSLRCTRDAGFTRYLFDLKHLTALAIYDCFTSPRTKPVTICGLSWEKFSNTLTTLEFRSNPGLTGNIPSSIGNLRQLQSLVLLENGLSGNLPIEIGNLVNLKRLVISANGFNGRIPDSVGQLTNLLILDMSRNSLSGQIPLTLGGLTSLLKLDLSCNILEGFLPKELGNLKKLTLLDIGRNNLTGGLARSFQDMVSIKEMVMSNNPLLKGDLRGIEWGNLENLQGLDLANTGLQGNIPDTLSRLKMLRYLGLENNSLTGTPPRELASLPCISALYLCGNNLTGELEFPQLFYTKMGRRFSGWDNPNLCCRLPPTSSPSVDAPHGMKPCVQENSSIHIGEYLTWESHLEVSSGCRRCNRDALFWGLMLSEILRLIFLNHGYVV